MARKRTSIDDKIQNQSSWDEHHLHLLWHGKLHRGHPTVRDDQQRHLHPIRHLLNLHHPRLVVKRVCLHELCINAEHYDVRLKADPIQERPDPVWNDPRPSAFDHHDLADIEWGLELLEEGKSFTHPDFENISHLIEEIKRRWDLR